MTTPTIQQSNALFNQGRYKDALTNYLRCQEMMPSLAHTLEISIELCRRRMQIELDFPNSIRSKYRVYEEEIVRFFPDYSATNPYQKLLYSDRTSSKFKISAGTLADAVRDLTEGNNKRRVIFHLHWVSHVLSGAASLVDANDRVDVFLVAIKQFVSLGGDLVWTIHNSIEHDCKYLEPERRLRTGICDLAMRVHIHSELAIPEIEKHYELPRSKLLVVPHGNYVGYYSDFVARATARKYLEINDDEIVFLCLGMIRPYKGLDKLLEAFSIVRSQRPNAKLIIAGKVVHPYKVEQIRALANAYAGVILIPKEIPDQELQYYFRGADATVLAYKSILTSGSIYLALSYGQPVIGPDVPAIQEVIQEGKNGISYDFTAGPNALAEAMLAFCSKSPQQHSIMRDYSASEISRHTWTGAVDALFSQDSDSIRSYEQTERSEQFEIDLQTVQCEIYEPQFPKIAHQVAILILNYESSDDVAELIASIESIGRVDLLPIIVDNNSPSESLEKLRARFKNCVIIRTPSNLGYAAGNNVGIRYIEGRGIPFTWILNPDTVVTNSTLDALLDGTVSSPTTDIWGSLITYYDRPKVIWFGGGFVSVGAQCSIGHMYHEKNIAVAPSAPFDVDYVTGASIFCRTAVFSRAGLIPEHYFLYFEETDWCMRAKRCGLKIQVNPQSVLMHKKRSQVGQMPTKYYMYYFVRGAILFRLRYSGASAERARREVMETFVNPWLGRIGQASPQDRYFFEQLALRAIEDGSHGRSGPVNLGTILGSFEWVGKSSAEYIVGDFKITSSNHIEGKIKNLAQPSEKVTPRIWIDGQQIGTPVLSAINPELQGEPSVELGWRFEFLIPEKYVDDNYHAVKVIAEGVELCCSSPGIRLKKSDPKYIGRLDGLQDRTIKGWCIDEANPQTTISVEILCLDKVIAVAPNDIARPDLAKAGYKSQLGGFSTHLPLEFCTGDEYSFSFRIAGTKKIIHSRKLRMDMRKYPLAPANASYEDLSNWIFSRRELSFTQIQNIGLPALNYLETIRSELAIEAGKSTQEELVSIIMPVYNRETVIVDALESCLAQSYKNWELVICDDGSSDSSISVIQEFVDIRGIKNKVKILVLPHNAGVSAARNFSLKHATGSIIAYLDSDNSWDSDYLLIMVNGLKQSGPFGCVYCGDRIVQHYSSIEPNVSRSEIIALRFGPYNKTLLENKNYIDLNVFVHYRGLYDNYGGFNENMTRLVDWELIVRYSQVASIRFIPAILVTYNHDFSSNQITKLHDYNQNALKLKDSVTNIRRENISRLVSRDLSMTQTTSNFARTLVVLINDDANLPPNFELICGAWLNSPGREINIVLFNTIGKSDTSEEFELSQLKCSVTDSNSTTIASIITDFYNSLVDISGAAVIASVSAIPTYGWSSICSEIVENDKSITAVSSTRYVSGATARRFDNISFQNSRDDFDFDVAPLEFDAVFNREEFSAHELLEIKAPSRFFTYLPYSTLREVATNGAFQSEMDIFEILGSATAARRNKILFSPNISVQDCRV